MALLKWLLKTVEGVGEFRKEVERLVMGQAVIQLFWM
jgi:hypothetical protein